MEGSVNMNTSSTDDYDGPNTYTVYVSSILSIALNTFVLVFGALGNTLILRVYHTKTRRTTTHILIMGLALADLMVCLSLTGYIIESSYALLGKDELENMYLCENFINIWLGGSVGVTGFIAVDRYDNVCRHNKRVLNNRRAKIAILVSLILSVIAEVPILVSCSISTCNGVAALPSWIIQGLGFLTALFMIGVCYGKVFMTIRRHVRVGINLVSPKHSPEKGGQNTKHKLVVGLTEQRSNRRPRPDASCSNKTQQTFQMKQASSVLFLASLHSDDTEKIGKALDKTTREVSWNEGCLISTRSVEQATASSVSPTAKLPVDRISRKPRNTVLQRRTTKMLFITSVVFLLSWLPFWLTVLVGNFGQVDDQDILYVLQNVMLKTMFVNNAVNPIVYSLANRRFREEGVRELRKMAASCAVLKY